MRSPVTYHLSKSQEKDLLERGTQIRVALPVPPHDLHDVTAWARSVFTRDIAAMITAAEECQLWTEGIKSKGTDDCLTFDLGNIREPDGKTFVTRVACVIVTLTPSNVRRRIDKPKWPATVGFLGKVLPPQGTD